MCGLPLLDGFSHLGQISGSNGNAILTVHANPLLNLYVSSVGSSIDLPSQIGDDDTDNPESLITRLAAMFAQESAGVDGSQLDGYNGDEAMTDAGANVNEKYADNEDGGGDSEASPTHFLDYNSRRVAATRCNQSTLARTMLRSHVKTRHTCLASNTHHLNSNASRVPLLPMIIFSAASISLSIPSTAKELDCEASLVVIIVATSISGVIYINTVPASPPTYSEDTTRLATRYDTESGYLWVPFLMRQQKTVASFSSSPHYHRAMSRDMDLNSFFPDLFNTGVPVPGDSLSGLLLSQVDTPIFPEGGPNVPSAPTGTATSIPDLTLFAVGRLTAQQLLVSGNVDFCRLITAVQQLKSENSALLREKDNLRMSLVRFEAQHNLLQSILDRDVHRTVTVTTVAPTGTSGYGSIQTRTVGCFAGGQLVREWGVRGSHVSI
ncbi:hypothetical protein PENSPDRAFT_672066 [Peniophora sp. CONT]|nr:hypothetical protein PENSPDRAFT_672066 [Peniophora sp. CONT]